METVMNCPHCETEIDEHEANRCLDAWVAEVVMGHRSWKVVSGGEEFWREGEAEIADLRFYSTDIAAAWEVIEHMKNRTDFAVNWLGVSEGYNASFLLADWVTATASTAHLAICRAALKAMKP